MGLFKSKKKTTVGTTVQRVVEDKSLPNSLQTGTLKGVFANTGIPENILEEFVSGIGLKAERMYRYADKYYTYGLPSGSTRNAMQGTNQVTAILQAEEGQAVSIDYSIIGPPNMYHLGWVALIEQYNYNSITNEVLSKSAQRGRPVYLEKMELIVPASEFPTMELTSLEQWGDSSIGGYTFMQPIALQSVRIKPQVIVSSTATTTRVRATVMWENPALPPLQPGAVLTTQQRSARYLREVLTISVSDYDEEDDFLHVKYQVGSQTKYRVFLLGNDEYPILDALLNTAPSVAGTYFPFLYFRFGKQSMDALKGSQAYSTSRKLARYVSINYGQMIETIHSNPDIDDVEQAMLIMAVPAVTNDQFERRYLFDYFKSQSAIQNPPNQSNNTLPNRSLLNIGGLSSAMNATIIQDKRFKMTLANNGISRKLVAGKIGKIGFYGSGIRNVGSAGTYVDEDTGETVSYSSVTPEHYYRKQISASVYEEVAVRDLRMTYHVYGKYSTVGDESDPILLIPIDRSITKNYPFPVKEKVYSRSLHYVFNSRVVTKIKWYQTGLFKVIVMAIGIAIAIYTYGAALSGLAAGVAAGTIQLSTILLNAAMGLLKHLAISQGIQMFVKAVGEELGFLLAVLAVAAGAVAGMTSGFGPGTWAENLLKVATSIVKGVQDVIQSAMTKLQEEFEQFGLFVQEQSELIEQSMNLLESKSLISPFIIFGETPQDFYNRTIHSGNIGTMGMNAIESYVESALRLPRISDTVGEEENAG